MSNVQLNGPWRVVPMSDDPDKHEIIDGKGQRVCVIDFDGGQPETLALIRSAPTLAALLMAWCEGCTGVKPTHGALLGQTATELNIIAHALMGEEKDDGDQADDVHGGDAASDVS